MGEAKLRRLAGTYPKQDGGASRPGRPSIADLPPDARKVVDALVDQWVSDRPELIDAAAGSAIAARDAIYALVDLGLAKFEAYEFATGVSFRVVMLARP